MNKYERLTKRDEEFGIIALCPSCSRKAICDKQEECVDCITEEQERLAELEDKIENGTLIELPCKVGDTFYYVSQIKNKVEKHNVTGFEISKELRIRTISDCYSNGNYIAYFYSSYFNKTLFKTKAEAEAKLKELQEKGNER